MGMQTFPRRLEDPFAKQLDRWTREAARREALATEMYLRRALCPWRYGPLPADHWPDVPMWEWMGALDWKRAACQDFPRLPMSHFLDFS